LPGKYAEPHGQILLLKNGDEIVGGAALRPLDDDGICEMKRLYVREEWRGAGYGRELTVRILESARQAGYKRISLDTERRLTTTIDMYRKFGFEEIGKYYDNPMDDILYLELALR